MCIIRIIKEGNVSSEEIEALWEENPHGGGIAMIDNDLNLKVLARTNYIYLFKKELFNQIEKNNFKSLVFHMRYRSKGSLNTININPIQINETTVMFHNGTLQGYDNDFYSDTLMYVFNVLHSIEELDIDNQDHIKQIKNSLYGNGSRLVFLQKGKAEPLVINNKGIGYWYKNKTQWTSK